MYNSSSSQIWSFKLLACFCDCTSRFVSDLVGNPEDRFPRIAAYSEVCYNEVDLYQDRRNAQYTCKQCKKFTNFSNIYEFCH